ncbi:hypothetical protein LRH25_12845 [Ideonella azotifigens]|nr:CrpP-related protein [Ideonella azotifigens]MCD2341229.1 hypothetical protein [Ideonella azotifigens]
MKKRHGGGLLLAGLPWPAEGQLLPASERAELARQGAKAAARGETSEVNPMAGLMNLPAATGEPRARWAMRYEAWQAGHDAHRSGKPDAPSSGPEAGHDTHQ